MPRGRLEIEAGLHQTPAPPVRFLQPLGVNHRAQRENERQQIDLGQWLLPKRLVRLDQAFRGRPLVMGALKVFEQSISDSTRWHDRRTVRPALAGRSTDDA